VTYLPTFALLHDDYRMMRRSRRASEKRSGNLVLAQGSIPVINSPVKVPPTFLDSLWKGRVFGLRAHLPNLNQTVGAVLDGCPCRSVPTLGMYNVTIRHVGRYFTPNVESTPGRLGADNMVVREHRCVGSSEQWHWAGYTAGQFQSGILSLKSSFR